MGNICNTCKYALVLRIKPNEATSPARQETICTYHGNNMAVENVVECNKHEISNAALLEEGMAVAEAHRNGTLTITGNDKMKKHKVPKM